MEKLDRIILEFQPYEIENVLRALGELSWNSSVFPKLTERKKRQLEFTKKSIKRQMVRHLQSQSNTGLYCEDCKIKVVEYPENYYACLCADGFGWKGGETRFPKTWKKLPLDKP